MPMPRRTNKPNSKQQTDKLPTETSSFSSSISNYSVVSNTRCGPNPNTSDENPHSISNEKKPNRKLLINGTIASTTENHKNKHHRLYQTLRSSVLWWLLLLHHFHHLDVVAQPVFGRKCDAWILIGRRSNSANWIISKDFNFYVTPNVPYWFIPDSILVFHRNGWCWISDPSKSLDVSTEKRPINNKSDEKRFNLFRFALPHSQSVAVVSS